MVCLITGSDRVPLSGTLDNDKICLRGVIQRFLLLFSDCPPEGVVFTGLTALMMHGVINPLTHVITAGHDGKSRCVGWTVVNVALCRDTSAVANNSRVMRRELYADIPIPGDVPNKTEYKHLRSNCGLVELNPGHFESVFIPEHDAYALSLQSVLDMYVTDGIAQFDTERDNIDMLIGLIVKHCYRNGIELKFPTKNRPYSMAN